ncbi:MAG TPA: DUF2834 domain-containing protein [Candidatus Binatia bacterium]|nr:DUF2834 domain-containing protein [Candidatus Binatia bacterium]
MNWKKLGLWVVFADFLAFTAWVVYEHGYSSFFTLAAGSAVGAQMLLDLAIALTMVLTWLVRDARERGISPTPYVVLTLFAGSIGPLLYLVRRRDTEPARVARVAVRA